MMKPVMLYLVLLCTPIYTMQQFSPPVDTGVLPGFKTEESIKGLGIEVSPADCKHILAKKIVPSLQQFIDENAPTELSDSQRLVVLLQMVNRILPGKKLVPDN